MDNRKDKTMKLKIQLKTYIDSLEYIALLRRWRCLSMGDPLFQGESGAYFKKRMQRLEQADPDAAVKASRIVGGG